MTAYREIVRDESDMTKVKSFLDSIKSEVEIIILPIEKRDEELLINAQECAMSRVWNNDADKGWDDV
jgi:hypothetical protein